MKVPLVFSARNVSIIAVTAVVTVLAGLGVARLWNRMKSARQPPPSIVAQVRSILDVPAGDEPIVKTVGVGDGKGAGSVFPDARQGDAVLIFSRLKKAVLYRPSTHKIVDMSPIAPDTAPAVATETATPSGSMRFVILNGTKTAGLTKRYESDLKRRIPGAEVTGRGNTVGDYTTSFVVDAGQRHGSAAASISRTLSLPLMDMPHYEASVSGSADYVVILGTDYK